MYIRRSLEATIGAASSFFPVLLVNGPRQVGKTTLLRQCASGKRDYVSLDAMDKREQAQNDPALFLERYRAPLLIDEIQYAPQLLPHIKERVDAARQSGMYWLTGSQQFSLMQGVTESLAGRVGILHLQGLSQAEKDECPEREPFLPSPEAIARRARTPQDLPELFRRIWLGSYPALWHQGDQMRTLFYESYLQTYLERDVRQILNVNNLHTFSVFMRAIAAQTAQVLSLSSLARDISVSVPTIKSWLSVLESSGIIYLLQPYANNLLSRAIKPPKLYFTDTGLACYLTRWDSPAALEAGAYSGAIFETYVVTELFKSYLHHGKRPALYFYRDKDRREIDILLEQNGELHPMEIKKKSAPTLDDIKAFSRVAKQLGRPFAPGAVLCAADTHRPLTEEISVVPVSYI